MLKEEILTVKSAFEYNNKKDFIERCNVVFRYSMFFTNKDKKRFESIIHDLEYKVPQGNEFSGICIDCFNDKDVIEFLSNNKTLDFSSTRFLVNEDRMNKTKQEILDTKDNFVSTFKMNFISMTFDEKVKYLKELASLKVLFREENSIVVRTGKEWLEESEGYKHYKEN